MNWFAVHTKPHQEHLAELNLHGLGVETFLPQIKQSKVIRRRRETIIGPLFPGYLFARFHLEAHYRAVTYARGVRKVVAFGSTPAEVDEGIIEAIKSRLHDGYVTVPVPTFTPGQLVRIQQGPLQGMEAIFEREMSDNQRAALLLRTLAFPARVIVDIDQVANL
jgi:transcriptional antiterminator RfaH